MEKLPSSADLVWLADASKSEARKRSHYARPGQAPFDERSYELATPSRWKSLGASGMKAATQSIDQAAAITIVGGTDGSSLARKGVCKEHILQMISVTTQVAISRHRHQLAIRGRQAARGRREDTGGVLMPMAWGWNVDEEQGQRGFANRKMC